MAALKEEHGDCDCDCENETDEIQREKYVLIKAEMKQRYRHFLFAHSFV